ncbi:MAG: hypothetical protein COA38_11185 [Fluviicola sp.]|nr:MAG: hypothetical protein COA38_11185 [Fluviicola sp.]
MIHIFFQASNILVTILFLVIIIYWLVVLFGAVDFDTFDFDFDIDLDVDVDVDADVDSANIFGLNKVLYFFNLGRVPFMIFLTFLVLPWWFGTVLVNHWLGFEGFLTGLLVTVPMFFLALFVAKILTTPFVKIFDALDKENVDRDVLGTVGEVRMMATSDKTGQAQFKLGGAFLTLDIRVKEGKASVGEKVMIINDGNKDNYYLVEQHFEI